MATAKVADLVTTMRADTAKFDRDIENTKKRLRGYTTDAKNSVKQNDSLGRSFVAVAGSASQLPGPLGRASSGVESLSMSVGLASSGWGALGVAASVAIGAIAAGLPVLAETERRLLQQEQLLKATGFASGFTADQLDELARSVAMATLTSTEQASKAIGAMLTFKSVSGSTFKQAIHLSQDLASVMGGDITSAAKQLGKALEMPSIGVSSLRESGISFTASQMDMIKAMEEAGEVAEAQQVVLKALETQIGGAASAEAGGLIGAVDTLGQAVEESFEAFTKWTEIKPIITDIINEMSEGALAVRDFFDPTGTDKALDLMSERAKIIQKMNEAGSYDELPSINPFGYSKNEYKNDQRRLYEIHNELSKLREDRNKRILAENEAQEKAQQAADARERQRLEEKATEEEKARQEKADKEQKRLDEKETRELAAEEKARNRAKQQTDAWLVELDRRNMTELELLNAKYMDEAMKLTEKRQQDLISEERYQEALQDIQLYYSEQRKETLQKEIEEQEKQNQGFWDRYYESMQKSAENTDELWRQTFDSFTTGFGNAFASAVMQSESVGDAFKNMAQGMAQSMLAALGKIMAQRMVMWALEKTMLKGSIGGEVARVNSEAQSSALIAGINAFKSTAAIPIVGPALAPGAMTAALAVTEPMAAAATTAAASGFAGMFDNGGYIPAGTWGVTGEYGPEITLGPSHVIGRKNTMDLLNANKASNSPDVAVSVYEAPPGTYVERRWSSEDEKMVINIMCKDAHSSGDHFSYIQSKLGIKAGGYK